MQALAGYRVVTFCFPSGYPRSFQIVPTGCKAGAKWPDFDVGDYGF